ncbi:magnesium transporter [Desulfohalobium retbaense]|uniref:Magnesium transporter MgtE n=1 Tax=Desulfohalobium retbaense (strain ATCC 49708 / DSM 5692 / JCM 16813 / HR100) TaxID=485915 RepID=C8X0E3_DESRD|nr:magnesium transporter [Desulfohalobium retbaense]ACV67768.1 magnesium transporter [Desulfohalobium retbaense DSM 5692]
MKYTAIGMSGTGDHAASSVPEMPVKREVAMTESTTVVEHLLECIASGDAEQAVTLYDTYSPHPADWAEYVEPMGVDALAQYIELVGASHALPFFEFVSFELQKEVLLRLSRETLADLVSQMSPDDRADLLDDMEDALQERILSLLIRAERQNIIKLINYDEDSAGGYMTTDYALIRFDDTVSAALEQLRLQAPKKETIYYIYVVDKALRLIGFVSLRELIMAPRYKLVRDVMSKSVISVRVNEDIEEVAKKMQHYDFLAIPVVSEDERLVGIITFDDIYDVIQEETAEDMYLLANLDADESLNSPVGRSVKMRAPWLLVNLCTALFVAYTVDLFSDSISQFVALAALMPIVAMLGGNAGNQSLTVVVRALALGEVPLRDNWRVLLKEAGVGFVNGMLIGGVMGAIAWAWYDNVWLGLIILVAMSVNLVVAGFFGSLIPVTLRKLKLDPALGSSILVTTATDVGGFLIFLGLATIFLQQLLGG